jgi:hypothetical protein
MISENTLKQLNKESKIVYYLVIAFLKLLESKKLRDLGKLLAESNEYIQEDWINENTNLKVKKRQDNDLNASGFDLTTFDEIMTIQGKIRVGTMHLEQTRRKSTKNEDSSDTGQVAYSVGEADVYLFSRPDKDEYGNIDKWSFIAIPQRDLIDLKNPKYLITNIPKKIWGKYVGNTKETLESEYLKILVNKHKNIIING